jgi:hypothetical protein
MSVLRFVALSILLLGLVQPAAAQSGSCSTDSVLAADTAGIQPDVLLRATVRARSLRFERVPEQKLQLLGCPARDRFVVTTRTNLPTPVQPGVTYHDAVISIEIRSYWKCTVREGGEREGDVLAAAGLCARRAAGSK